MEEKEKLKTSEVKWKSLSRVWFFASVESMEFENYLR